MAVAVPADPSNWDPSSAEAAAPTADGLALAFEPLLGFKQGPDVRYGDITLTPRLAMSWEIPDTQNFIFHLRSGLRWSPMSPLNGRELTSADVRWSYEYLSRTGAISTSAQPPSRLSSYFEGIESIATADSSTVAIQFNQPFVPFLTYAASDSIGILPHEIFDQDGRLSNRAAGSGPFQIDPRATLRGARWVWRKNANYWDTGKPRIDELDWLVINDLAAILMAFRTRQIDWIGRDLLSASQAAQLKKQDPTAVEYNFLKPAAELLLNQRVPALADVRVRQAIGLALNRDELIRALDGGDGAWALAGGLPDTFTQPETRQILRFDASQSKRLLAAAGHGDDVSLELLYAADAGSDAHVAALQLVQSQLDKVGIKIRLKRAAKGDFDSARRDGAFDLVLTTRGGFLPDVDASLYTTFLSGSSSNYGAVSDAELDGVLQAQRREIDPGKRRELVRGAVRRINEQGYALALDARTSYEFWRPTLRNYAPQYGTARMPLPETWLDRP